MVVVVVVVVVAVVVGVAVAVAVAAVVAAVVAVVVAVAEVVVVVVLVLVSPQAMGGLPPKHAVQTFLGGLDCDFTGCGSGCPPGNSDLRLTS